MTARVAGMIEDLGRACFVTLHSGLDVDWRLSVLPRQGAYQWRTYTGTLTQVVAEAHAHHARAAAT